MKKTLCEDCAHKYRCDADRLACSQFRFFVNTGQVSGAEGRVPTRAIYIDVFHTEPSMGRKEKNDTHDTV